MNKRQVTTTKPEAGQQATWPGAFAAFSKIFEQIKANPGPALLYVGVYAAIALFGWNVEPTNLKSASTWAGLAGLAGLVFLLAVPTYGLALADRKRLSLSDFMQFDVKKYLSVLAAVILTGLIVGVSLLLLIIPAIFTIAWFFASAFAVIDKNMGPIQALKESKRLLKNHKGKVWGVIGVTILLSIAASILSVIPLLGDACSALISLWSSGTAALLYRWSQQQA